MHYNQLSPEERFKINYVINIETNCWEWTKSLNKNGYGRLKINKKWIRAHRFSFKYYNGYIDNTLEVCHHCDNRMCVNPKHLFQGTHLENFADAKTKNRLSRVHQPKGEDSPTSKLTEIDVLKIRNMDGTLKSIAKIYGVHLATIGYIKQRKSWKHI